MSDINSATTCGNATVAESQLAQLLQRQSSLQVVTPGNLSLYAVCQRATMVNQRLIWSASVCITLALIGALTVLSGPFWPGHEVCWQRTSHTVQLKSGPARAPVHCMLLACSLRSFTTVAVCVHRLLTSHLPWFCMQSFFSSMPNWCYWHIWPLNR